MRSLLLVGALASPAFADTELELEVAAGASSTDGVVSRSSTGHLVASVTRWVPTEQRGMCDGNGCFWLFTSVVDTDRDGIGVDIDADHAATARYDARVWGAYRGWSLGGRAAY